MPCAFWSKNDWLAGHFISPAAHTPGTGRNTLAGGAAGRCPRTPVNPCFSLTPA